MAQVKQRKAGELLKRFSEIRSEDVKEDTRSVAVSFSSETTDVRSPWSGAVEVLLHEAAAASFQDLERTGSVLFNHKPDAIVGRPKDVKLDLVNRVGRATIVFDDDAEADRIFKKVKGGSLRGVSVGFKVSKWQLVGDGERWTSPEGRVFEGPADIAIKWRAKEFSLTPIPADGSVGVERNQGENPDERTGDMTVKVRAALVKRGLKADASDEEAEAFLLRITEEPEADAKAPVPKPAPPPPPAPAPAPTPAPNARSEDEIRLAERQRVSEIRDVCGFYPETEALADGFIEDGSSLEAVVRACSAKRRETRKALPSARAVTTQGENQRDKFAAAATDHILMRAGSLRDKDKARLDARTAAARDVEASSLLELARECIRQGGGSARGLSRDDLLVRAFHSTSDFPKILENAAFKAVMLGWEEAPSTWQALARRVSVPDFKASKRVRMGDMGDLVLTPELTPAHEGSIPEMGDSLVIDTYSKKFGISRQAMVNDDLNAFSDIPMKMGAAAKRLPQKLFFDVLISAAGVGPTMAEDSLPLFSTTHTSGANYIAAAGAPDLTGLAALMKLMRLQKGSVAAGETAPVLNIQPDILLVPAALEVAALQIVNSSSSPAGVNSNVYNPYSGRFQVVVESRLDGATNGTTAWYLVANPNSVAGAEVAFLNGQETPQTLRDDSNPIMGIQWTIWTDCGVKFIGHRGWARSRGA